MEKNSLASDFITKAILGFSVPVVELSWLVALVLVVDGIDFRLSQPMQLSSSTRENQLAKPKWEDAVFIGGQGRGLWVNSPYHGLPFGNFGAWFCCDIIDCARSVQEERLYHSELVSAVVEREFSTGYRRLEPSGQWMLPAGIWDSIYNRAWTWSKFGKEGWAPRTVTACAAAAEANTQASISAEPWAIL